MIIAFDLAKFCNIIISAYIQCGYLRFSVVYEAEYAGSESHSILFNSFPKQSIAWIPFKLYVIIFTICSVKSEMVDLHLLFNLHESNFFGFDHILSMPIF